jgi:hypothetical protein
MAAMTFSNATRLPHKNTAGLLFFLPSHVFSSLATMVKVGHSPDFDSFTLCSIQGLCPLLSPDPYCGWGRRNSPLQPHRLLPPQSLINVHTNQANFTSSIFPGAVLGGSNQETQFALSGLL